MRFETRTITPEEAKNILDKHNKNNRPVKDLHVSNLARDIQNGKFKLNHQPIAIDKNGVLVDGQHRLFACVRANKAIRVVIAYDAPTEGLATVDRGRSRDVSEALAYEGYKLSKSRAGVCSILSCLERGIFKITGSRSAGYTSETVRELHDRYKETIDLFSNTYEVDKRIRRFLPVLVFVAQRDWTKRKALLEFSNQLVTGLNLTEDMPAYHLREWLLNTGNELYRMEGIHRIFYSVTKFLDGEKSRVCREMAHEAIIKTYLPELAQ